DTHRAAHRRVCVRAVRECAPSATDRKRQNLGGGRAMEAPLLRAHACMSISEHPVPPSQPTHRATRCPPQLPTQHVAHNTTSSARRRSGARGAVATNDQPKKKGTQKKQKHRPKKKRKRRRINKQHLFLFLAGKPEEQG